MPGINSFIMALTEVEKTNCAETAKNFLERTKGDKVKAVEMAELLKGASKRPEIWDEVIKNIFDARI